MRVLALDYGSARCGCALSDPTGMVATPIDPVLRPNTKRGFAQVTSLVRDREVGQVVIGLPLRLSGGDSDQTREARDFADRVAAATGVPVALEDERFTTLLAQRAGGKASEDSRAAAVLLEGWLARNGAVA
jgi:putative holliday junction resolvase